MMVDGMNGYPVEDVPKELLTAYHARRKNRLAADKGCMNGGYRPEFLQSHLFPLGLRPKSHHF
ncbi:MAG: hypothetical protein ACOCZH_03190 [Phototrophicaceae bacterium]